MKVNSLLQQLHYYCIGVDVAESSSVGVWVRNPRSYIDLVLSKTEGKVTNCLYLVHLLSNRIQPGCCLMTSATEHADTSRSRVWTKWNWTGLDGLCCETD